ncbi:transcriptional regulator, LysR family [Thioalkalivibrio sp. K90mix]|uniref:LysR family transcriptional regulator n=1 Tax=unclassified Thioalkalivibrio TaxID=2621013 RepID=UPI000195967A|nr:MULTISPECIES: LysR family transcriptional regulator [unclassified Thioalkalivibrio]ADC72576.1 transcriptional regulator, LysR family [Thioalkalivibrio sp. K90mix]
MDRFQQMQIFVAVVETGHFVHAAETLGLSKAAVSRAVNGLEERLGARLLHRTTRRLSLTSEGETFFGRSKLLLEELAAAEGEISERGTAVSGRLRINVPVSFGIQHLAPLWGTFTARHPRVELDVTLNDRSVDLVDEGFDLAVRIGTLDSSSLVARRLATTRMRICAAPDYLAASGLPAHPRELADHATIAYSYHATGDDWTLTGPDGPVAVTTRPVLRSNNGETCVAAALAGQGIVYQPEFLLQPHLQTGALQVLFPDWETATLGIHAVYPSRRYLLPKTRALIDFLAQQLGTPNGLASR